MGALTSRDSLPLILVTGLLYQAMSQATRPMMSLYAHHLGGSPAQIGLVAAGFSLVAFLPAVPIGRLIDRVGVVPVTLAGMVCLLLLGLAPSIGPGWPGLVAVTVLGGLAHALVYISLHAAMAGTGQDQQLSRNMGYYTFAESAGQFVGPVLAGWLLDRSGYGAAFGMVSAVAVLGLVATWLRSPSILDPGGRPGGTGAAAAPADVGARAQPGPLALLRVPGMISAIVTSAAVMMGVEVYFTFLPVHVVTIGSGTLVGLLLGAYALCAALVRPFLGAMHQLLRRPAMVPFCLLVSGLTLGVMGLTYHVPLLFVLSGVFGVFHGILQPYTMVMVAHYAPPGLRGTAMSLRIASNRAARSAGPLVLGWIGGFWGYLPVFLLTGLCMAAPALLYRQRAAADRLAHQRSDSAML